MDAVDRITATDRAVAAYRRFVDADNLNVVPDMISDLLHWYRIMIDRRVDVSSLTDMVTNALVQYEAELSVWGEGNDPSYGNRAAPDFSFRQEFPTTASAAFSVQSEALAPPPMWGPEPDEVPWDHPGRSDTLCNCIECCEERAAQSHAARSSTLAERAVDNLRAQAQEILEAREARVRQIVEDYPLTSARDESF